MIYLTFKNCVISHRSRFSLWWGRKEMSGWFSHLRTGRQENEAPLFGARLSERQYENEEENTEQRSCPLRKSQERERGFRHSLKRLPRTSTTS